MKKKFLLLILVLFILDIIFSLPCHGNLVCTGPTMTTFLQYPSLWIFLLIPLCIIALTLKQEKHKFWLKLTGIFFSVSMLIVFIMPEYDPGIFSVDRELTNWFFLGLYSIVSITYFIFQFFKKKK